ncbi:MAG TPA: monovalent cation/H+ antiporter subunit D [Candidatus Competibacteraceae bacterium]|nr:monovalent cation/H+ antiporter subunit D [Candidatus Competibacteraceae bacterium]
MNLLVIAPVLLPLLAGILLLLLSQSRLTLQRTLSVMAVAAQIGLALALMATVNNSDILVYTLGNWPAPFGIVLVADRLAAWMLVITALLALFALLYAIRGDDTVGWHFHTLFQFQLFGLNGAFLTGDLFNLFVFFEILLLASYGLLLHGGRRQRIRAGLHFVVINLAGSTLFLFAVGTLYGVLGTLNMADLAIKVAAAPPENVPLVRAAGLLLFGVFALKAALLPLYLWLPAAYAHTSAPVAALFAIMTKIGAYSILRVYTLIFGPEAGPAANLIEFWLLPLALATLIVGMIGAVASAHLRQQAAYLVVASVGSLLTAFGLNSHAGIAAGLFYLPHTTFAAAALFLLADLIARQRGVLNDRLDPGPDLPDSRLLGALFFITAIAVAGLPPLAGFLGKFLMLQAALDHPFLPWVMGTVLVAALLGVIALARTGSLLFYRVDPETAPAAPWPPIRADIAPVIGLLLLVLGLTIGAGPVFDQSRAIADQVLQPQLYIQAVMNSGRTP